MSENKKEYKNIISNSLQELVASAAINIHPMDGFFIMEVNYELIIDAIVDNLNKNGYTIIKNKEQ
jgi:hypothetical protein